MRAAPLAIVIAIALCAGCPQQQNTEDTGPVKAVLAISATMGAAPLTVNVSAVDSTSINGGPLIYAWDFGDGGTSTGMTALHIFANPGRYTVRLRVSDPTGAFDTDAAEVRVSGGSVIAVIAADRTSGGRPLTVQFDGTQSIVLNDTIRDYLWDFDDGGTSFEPKPRHTFTGNGEYNVELRVITQGGNEARTTTRITVGERAGSILFDGSSLATLPFGTSQTLEDCTFEAWVRLEPDGGNVATIGNLRLDLIPRDNRASVSAGGVLTTGTATGLTANWRHVALVYDGTASSGGGGEGGAIDPNAPTGSCTVYVDGVQVLTRSVSGPIAADRITLGNALRGKMGEVRFWSTLRTTDQLAANRNRRISAPLTGLVGAWPLNDGSNQTLRDNAGTRNGYLGSSADVDAADAAWSSDSPPL